MKKFVPVSIIALMTLGACSHYSEDLASLEGKIGARQQQIAASYPATTDLQSIAPAAGGAEFSREAFNQTLASEYFTMAKYENEKAYDYKAAKLYTQKAKMASEGKVVVPSKVSAFDVPEEKQGELNEARANLIEALKNQNTPENQRTLGVAQARYECWLERAEEAADDAHYASCKNDFDAAMAQLIVPAAGHPQASAAMYNVGFSANSTQFDAASAQTINSLAAFLNMPENAAYTANLTGFTGMAQGEYAETLANARVIAVRDALAKQGVNAARLSAFVSKEGQASDNGKVEVSVSAATTATATAPVQVQAPAPTPAPAVVKPVLPAYPAQ